MKFYVALLDGLTAGERTAQVAHAVTEFALAHPHALRAWRDGSNTVAVVELAGPDLGELARAARLGGDTAADFSEPDRGGERTAVALFPTSPVARRIVRRARPSSLGATHLPTS